MSELNDVYSERSVLSAIYSHGKDAFFEASEYLDGSDDFSNYHNRLLYEAFNWIDKEGIEDFGYSNIQRAGRSIGKEKEFLDPSFLKYVSFLDAKPPSVSSLKGFCHDIKKWKVCRDLCGASDALKKYIQTEVKPETSIVSVIQEAEKFISDYVDGVVEGDDPKSEQLFHNLAEIVNKKLEITTPQKMGVSTGFDIWDRLTGGGPRVGGSSFIFARAKVGKSTLAMNIMYNTAMNGVPVLYLDTELIKPFVVDKMLCIHSGVPITDLETGSFNTNMIYKERVQESVDKLENLPIVYKNIAAKGINEIITICRSWLNRKVGFDEEGNANPCLIVYDYLKMTGDDVSAATPEWLKIGMTLTSLNAFLTKYKVALISMGQLNRQGITEIDEITGSSIAASDRIMWFGQSISVMANKSDEDGTLRNCGWEHGNKKLKILETRFGSGHESDSDYINLDAKIRPHVHESSATGKIKEGRLLSSVLKDE